MSRNAFAQCEREVHQREHQIEIARDERARGIDALVSEQQRREADFNRLRLDRAMNGPTPLEIAKQRIADLERQRDETAREITAWVVDIQAYFPGAATMHDIYRGIESLQDKIAAYEARDKWLNERMDYAEWQDKDGKPTSRQPEEDGFWNRDLQGSDFTFTSFIDATIKEGL